MSFKKLHVSAVTPMRDLPNDPSYFHTSNAPSHTVIRVSRRSPAVLVILGTKIDHFRGATSNQNMEALGSRNYNQRDRDI